MSMYILCSETEISSFNIQSPNIEKIVINSPTDPSENHIPSTEKCTFQMTVYFKMNVNLVSSLSNI